MGLLTILGVSANTASAAYEVPEFMKNLRGGIYLQGACDCVNSDDCSGSQRCDCTATCNRNGNSVGGGRCKDNVTNEKADTCPGNGGGNRVDCNDDERCNNNGFCVPDGGEITNGSGKCKSESLMFVDSDEDEEGGGDCNCDDDDDCGSGDYCKQGAGGC